MSNFYVKSPDKFRRSFSIYKQDVLPSGATKNITIQSPDVQSINYQFKKQQITFAEAKRQVELVRNRLAGKTPDIFNASNERLLDGIMEDYFKERPFIIDKASTLHKFKRAVKAIGKLSLLSITAEECLQCVLAVEGNEQQREVAHKLNSIFKRLKREIIVPVPPKEFLEVKYLNEAEIEKLAASDSTTPLVHAIILAFYSGLRIGEQRAIKVNDLLKGEKTLMVNKQLDLKNKIRPPKNRKKRIAYLHEDGLAAFKAFVNGPKFTHKQLNVEFQKLCSKVLGRTDLHWHDLRHSYAIHMLSAGVPIQLVAQSMGNSVRVCEERYAGFVMAEQGIETINRILKGE